MLKPLGDRVLIKPDEAPKTTDSGLHLVEDRKPENSGVVVALGERIHPLRPEAEIVASRLTAIASNPCWADSEVPDFCAHIAALLLEATAANPQIAVGDTVVFSWAVGQEIWIDDERYLLMKEADISAVLEGV